LLLNTSRFFLLFQLVKYVIVMALVLIQSIDNRWGAYAGMTLDGP